MNMYIVTNQDEYRFMQFHLEQAGYHWIGDKDAIERGIARVHQYQVYLEPIVFENEDKIIAYGAADDVPGWENLSSSVEKYWVGDLMHEDDVLRQQGLPRPAIIPRGERHTRPKEAYIVETEDEYTWLMQHLHPRGVRWIDGGGDIRLPIPSAKDEDYQMVFYITYNRRFYPTMTWDPLPDAPAETLAETDPDTLIYWVKDLSPGEDILRW